MSSLSFHCIITKRLPRDDPKRFCRATPALCFDAMKRLWPIAPLPEAIVIEISALERTCTKILAVKGCIVPDEDFRSGKRVTRASGVGLSTGRFRKSSRKATNTACARHPDAEESYQAFIASGVDLPDDESDVELRDVDSDDEDNDDDAKMNK